MIPCQSKSRRYRCRKTGTMALLTVEEQINIWADEAEDAIREILLALEDKTGKRIDAVNVYTRNLAECRTEIIFR